MLQHRKGIAAIFRYLHASSDIYHPCADKDFTSQIAYAEILAYEAQVIG